MAKMFDPALNFIHQPTLSANDELVWLFPEGASATFVRNDAVVLTTGRLQKAASPVAAGPLVGFADQDKTGTTDALIRVRVPRSTDVYVGFYQSDDTFATADVNAVGFDIMNQSGALWRIDQDVTSNPKVVILGIVDQVMLENRIQQGAAVVGTPVYCKFRNGTVLFCT